MKYYAGIDLGGTNIAGAIVDENNKILVSKSVKTKSERGFVPIADDIASLILQMVKEANLSLEEIQSVGVGSPGAINMETGIVYFAGNLKWENANLGEYLTNKLNKKVYVANDANCAALGEFLAMEEGKNYKSMAMITIGTGVGFGLILDNKVYSGATYGGTEYGHAMLVMDGEDCTCGRKGCIEAYASFSALLRDANRFVDANPQSYLAEIRNANGELTGKDLFDSAIKGEEDAVKIIDRFLEYIGTAIVSLTNLLDPEVIIIGGGISPAKDYFLPKLKSYVDNNRFCKQVASPEILVATLGNDAGIIGAARLAEH